MRTVGEEEKTATRLGQFGIWIQLSLDKTGNESKLILILFIPKGR